MKKTIWVIMSVIAFVIGMSIWQKNPPSQSRTDRTISASGFSNSTRQSPSKAETFAPDFTLPSLTGTTIHLADYRGKKPVILDFWTTWCPNCQRDMPHLNALYKQYKDQIEVIGVDLQEYPGTVRDFIETQGITFPIVIDAGNVANLYSIHYTNAHVFIKKDGTLFEVIPGDITDEAFLNLLR